MAINYVRFQRGTYAAFEILLNNGSYDNNTLYFIYDEDGTTSLYLGNKLISSSNEVSVNHLKDLNDVNIADALSNSFLVKDQNGQWIAKTPNEVASLIKEHLDIEKPIKLNCDNLSTEIIDNIIQLKDYGTQYYAFVPAVVDAETGIVKEPSKYVLTQGFKAGLEPRVMEINGQLELSWYEPSSENIDGINANIQNINSTLLKLETILGEPSTGTTEATGLYVSIENLETELNNKANIKDVYTKIATDQAIATAIANVNHLQRKKINSISEIDVTAADVEYYIFMVPTGFLAEDDKYDEYMVIDGAIEKVGSWEVNLDNYVTKNDLLFTGLSEDFFVDNKQLTLKDLSVDKLTDLESWLNNNAGLVKGLSENNLTDEFFAKLESSLLIKSIDENVLTLSDEGKLSIAEVEASKIKGLEELLNNKADSNIVTELKSSVLSIEEELRAIMAKEEVFETDIEEIKNILTWKEI